MIWIELNCIQNRVTTTIRMAAVAVITSGVSKANLPRYCSLPPSRLLLSYAAWCQIYIFQMYIFYTYNIYSTIWSYNSLIVDLSISMWGFLRILRKEKRNKYKCGLSHIPIYLIFPTAFIFPMHPSYDLWSVPSFLVRFL